MFVFDVKNEIASPENEIKTQNRNPTQNQKRKSEFPVFKIKRENHKPELSSQAACNLKPKFPTEAPNQKPR